MVEQEGRVGMEVRSYQISPNVQPRARLRTRNRVNIEGWGGEEEQEGG